MKKKISVLGIMLLALVVTLRVYAVPAYPKAVVYTQPDGSTVTVMMKGDEHIHWAESLDGYTLLPNSEGYMSYAVSLSNGDLVPSNIVANDEKNRTTAELSYLQVAKKGLSFSKAQFAQARAHRLQVPSKTTPQKSGNKTAIVGTQRVLVLLVSYADVAFSHTTQDFDNLYNQVGYSTGGVTGSVHDYYYESSYGQMNLQADVFGPIQLANNRAYYGGNDSNGSDSNPRAMVSEAVLAADSLYNVNFANYDLDNDGYVDCINVVFAGHGEEAGATSNAIWSHQWSISPTLTLDGVRVSSYSCSPECRGSSGTGLTYIGVICHELGHVFGAADYYDIDYSGYVGTGTWDIMASGSWNNSGVTPAHHNPYVKIYDYGWVTPKRLTTPCAVTMQPAETDKDSYYIVPTGTTNEVFILENKQQTGFDASIPGHGLVIYRKSSTMSSYGPNDSHPQGFYPICASSTYSIPTSSTSSYGSINSTGCPFPGSKKKTSFTDSTTPTAKAWDGTPTNRPITDITEANSVITFNFMGGPSGDPTDFVATLISPTQIDLSWKLTDNNPVMLVYNTINQFGTPANTTYNVGQSIYGGGTVLYVGSDSSFQHVNLQTGNHYFYKVYSKIPYGPIFQYSPGVAADVSTGCASIVTAFPITLDFETEIADECWTVTPGAHMEWDLSDGGTRYDLLSGSNYCGYVKYNSSSGDESYLTSPVLDFSSCANPHLTFVYINEKWSNDQDTLQVQYRLGTSNNWNVAQTYNTSVNNWTLDTVSLPANCTQVRFRGKCVYGCGIYLDDVRIGADVAVNPSDCAGADSLKWEVTPNGQVLLKWQGSAPTYLLEYTDLTTNQKSTYTVSDTLFYAQNINANHIYSWYVISLCSNAWSDTVKGGDFTMLPLAVEIVTVDNALSLLPNPTHEVLHISAEAIEEKSSCTIYDANGHLLMQFELMPGETKNINVTSWTQGTYFLKSESKRHKATQRFVKI
ncbi:MAG: M6 family metalloprotease domain-containing protein [Bacteroidales bacterium]|nr:M6 family metalloprotease domain-containing protein [Bacteroidales bacterium]